MEGTQFKVGPVAEGFDWELLAETARRIASKQGRKVGMTDIDETTHELIVWALDHSDSLSRYLTNSGLNQEEKAAKLYVTLERALYQRFTKETNERRDYLTGQTVVQYRALSRRQVLKMLPLAFIPHENLDPEHEEIVTAIRDAMLSATPAQMEILRLLGQGMTRKQIQEALGLSKRAVDRRLERLQLERRTRIPTYFPNKQLDAEGMTVAV